MEPYKKSGFAAPKSLRSPEQPEALSPEEGETADSRCTSLTKVRFLGIDCCLNGPLTRCFEVARVITCLWICFALFSLAIDWFHFSLQWTVKSAVKSVLNTSRSNKVSWLFEFARSDREKLSNLTDREFALFGFFLPSIDSFCFLVDCQILFGEQVAWLRWVRTDQQIGNREFVFMIWVNARLLNWTFDRFTRIIPAIDWFTLQIVKFVWFPYE